MRFYRGYLRF